MAQDALQHYTDYDGGGQEVELRGMLGAALSASWIDALIARGFGWHFDVGSFSTPITGGGNGTVLDADQPEFVIDVPQGTCLVPVRFDIACQMPLGAADSDESEINVLVDRAAVSGATATQGTVEAPTNMRTDKIGGCPCGVVSAVTTNTTAAPTVGMELIHRVKIFETKTDVAVLWTDLFALYEPLRPPFIVGPASVWGYWGGTVATTGFADISFLAFPSTLVTRLA